MAGNSLRGDTPRTPPISTLPGGSVAKPGKRGEVTRIAARGTRGPRPRVGASTLRGDLWPHPPLDRLSTRPATRTVASPARGTAWVDVCSLTFSEQPGSATNTVHTPSHGWMLPCNQILPHGVPREPAKEPLPCPGVWSGSEPGVGPGTLSLNTDFFISIPTWKAHPGGRQGPASWVQAGALPPGGGRLLLRRQPQQRSQPRKTCLQTGLGDPHAAFRSPGALEAAWP